MQRDSQFAGVLAGSANHEVYNMRKGWYRTTLLLLRLTPSEGTQLGLFVTRRICFTWLQLPHGFGVVVVT